MAVFVFLAQVEEVEPRENKANRDQKPAAMPFDRKIFARYSLCLKP